MTPTITVRRADFRRALREVATQIRGRTRTGLDAVLVLEGGTLTVDMGGAGIVVPAAGRLDGQLRAPATFLLGLAKILPDDDPVVLRVEGGRLRVGRLSVRVVWEGAKDEQISLPLDGSWVDVLRASLEHPPDVVVRSGLARLLRQAETRRDGLVRRAAALLAPFGVTTADVRDVVDRSLVRDGRAGGEAVEG